MMDENTSIGRTKTALVFGERGDAIAVLSSVIVRPRNETDERRITFAGPATFDATACTHIHEVILPIVDQVVTGLGIPQRCCEISVKNLGAASASDVGFQVSGFSADVPLFLAFLSAAVDLPLPHDIVSTGHIASSDGDISLVRAIPEKLDAAIAAPATHRFLYPHLDSDSSLTTLSPLEKERVQAALVSAKGKIDCVPVSDIAQLLEAITSDEALVSAGLAGGFFAAARPEHASGAPAKVIQHLLDDHEHRFWNTLEQQLLAGQSNRARHLLQARVRHEVSRQTYPEGCGRKLRQLVQSLPPATRRLKTLFPLLSTSECVQLGRFAAQRDDRDVRWLIEASAGEHIHRNTAPQTSETPSSADEESTSVTLDLVLAGISEEALAQAVGLPIDAARAAYVMDAVIVESAEEFHDTVQSFYLHLMRHTHAVTTSLSPVDVGPDAYALLERAYARQGGMKAAMAEGRDGTHGGMRCILDALTERFKQEEQEKQIKRILSEALDPLDWNSKVAFMAVFLRRIAPQLPPELQTEPPERYANQYETIIPLYVQSMDRLRERLRAL